MLNKVLQREIQQNNKPPLGYIENDAIGCYDRIMNPLVLLFLRKMGISTAVLQSLSHTWEQETHNIKTWYGVSDQSYGNATEYFLYGPGKGSTIGPILWLICFLLIYRSLAKTSPGMDFNPVCLTKYVSSKGAAFVDDTGLGTNQPFLTQGRANSGQHTLQEASVVSNLQVLAQQWECLLFSAGGALNLSKCFWFLISWRCTGGLLTMVMKAVNPPHSTYGTTS